MSGSQTCTCFCSKAVVLRSLRTLKPPCLCIAVTSVLGFGGYKGTFAPREAPLLLWLHSRLNLLGSPPLVLSLGSHGTWLLPHHHPHRSLTSKAEWSQLGRTVGRHWSFSLTWELFQVRGCVLFVVDLPAEHPAVFHEVLSLLFPFDRWGN